MKAALKGNRSFVSNGWVGSLTTQKLALDDILQMTLCVRVCVCEGALHLEDGFRGGLEISPLPLAMRDRSAVISDRKSPADECWGSVCVCEGISCFGHRECAWTELILLFIEF